MRAPSRRLSELRRGGRDPGAVRPGAFGLVETLGANRRRSAATPSCASGPRRTKARCQRARDARGGAWRGAGRSAPGGADPALPGGGRCTRCPLRRRTKAVFGAGNADADLMFIGEAPGRRGGPPGAAVRRPRGRAADQLLGGIGLPRRRLHRQHPQVPPARQPRPPAGGDRGLLAVPRAPDRADRAEGDRDAGQFRDQADHRQPGGITRVRGDAQVHQLGGRTVFVLPLFHPAAALRTPSVRRAPARGLRRAPRLLAEPLPAAATQSGGAGARQPRSPRRPSARAPIREPARPVRLVSSDRGDQRRPGDDRGARRAAGRRSRAGRGRARQRRARQRQDDLVRGACRALGVASRSCRRPSRSAAATRAGAGLAPGPLPARRPRPTRSRGCSTTT